MELATHDVEPMSEGQMRRYGSGGGSVSATDPDGSLLFSASSSSGPQFQSYLWHDMNGAGVSVEVVALPD
jgi:hypothetical protein